MIQVRKWLQIVLVLLGATCLLLYPLAVVWPSGWAWHSGTPFASNYFMMIVSIYATLGIFLIKAARNPAANRSLIWFTVWSSIAHGAVMAVQSMNDHMQHSHLWGDVPALLIGALVLGVLNYADEAGLESQHPPVATGPA